MSLDAFQRNYPWYAPALGASVVRFRMDLLLLYFSGNFQEKEDSGTKWITLFSLQPF